MKVLLLNLITFDHPGAGGQHVQGGRQGVAVDPLGVFVSRGLAWRKAFTKSYRTLLNTFYILARTSDRFLQCENTSRHHHQHPSLSERSCQLQSEATLLQYT